MASFAPTTQIPASVPATQLGAQLAAKFTPGASPLPGSKTSTLPFGAGKSWELHTDSTATDSIVQAIDGAKHVVNAEFFGVSDAGKGVAVTNALEAAAKRGVEVNVIADFTSVVAIPVFSFQRFKRRIEDAGGSVKVSFTLPLLNKLKGEEALRHVTHRKVVTIDGTTGYTGGINYVKISDDYHDAMVKLSGVSAARLAADQLKRWEEVGGKVTDRHVESVRQGLAGASLVPTDRTEFNVLRNDPSLKDFALGDGVVDMIRGAKQRLWITSPGFSDSAVIDEIRAAVTRGVDVRIVAPGVPPLGVPVINWVGRSHHKELVAAGAKVYEIPEVMHLKAIISDDEALLSSYNITKRSRLHDHEVGVRTADADFVKTMSDLVTDDMARSKQLKPEEMNDFGTKVGDFLVQTLGFNY